MPLLETRHIKKTRKDRNCEDCGRSLPKGSAAVAMYGMAHEGEKPWWMYTHERGTCPRPSAYAQYVDPGQIPTERTPHVTP